MMRTIINLMVFFTLVFLSSNALADEKIEKSMEELSKEIANPLAQIWNLEVDPIAKTIFHSD